MIKTVFFSSTNKNNNTKSNICVFISNIKVLTYKKCIITTYSGALRKLQQRLQLFSSEGTQE